MNRLSKRLTLLSELVTEGHVLADVGTDHGYIPIYLLRQKKIPRAIAMDIGEGPLLRAKEHIAEHGLGGYIETRLSDGVTALKPGEADTILMAGMGGGLILGILREGKNVVESAGELILQPQSEIHKVREYLYRSGYGIVRENMVREDGKFYQMMALKPLGEKKRENPDPVYCRYGELLLSEKHPVLKEYLGYMQNRYEGILANLKGQPEKPEITERRKQIELELAYIKQAWKYWR